MPPKRALWSEENLEAAVRAVQCGRLSTYKAAERYKVPRRTIRNQLMPTPAKNTEKTPIVRRKAINYRGTPVTKDLFCKNKIEKKTKKIKETKDDTNSKENNESWYCHGCKQDQKAAMRQCSKCSKWYHEECVGLTEEDDDNFECPDCN